MNYSELLNDVINMAEQVQKETGMKCVSAACIIVAVARLCAENYKGLTKYDDVLYPEAFEEERLRYLFKTVFKGGPGVIGVLMKSRLKKDSAKLDIDFLTEYKAELEAEATKRCAKVIPSDLVLLVAIKSLDPELRMSKPEFAVDFSVYDTLKAVDNGVCEYVMTETESVIGKLKAKQQQAEKIIKKRPAMKFAEPEEVLSLLSELITTEITDKSLKIHIKGFFNGTDDLTLVITRQDGAYYVHDDASSLAVLQKNSGENFQKVLDAIKGKLSLNEGRVLGAFCTASTLLHFIQVLIFVANGDLYYKDLDAELYSDNDINYVSADMGESFDANELIDEIKKSISCRYDEEKGLILALDMIYSYNNSTVSYLVETFERTLKISDNRKGCFEGEIFESLYARFDDIKPFKGYIEVYCKRFGADFDGESVSISSNTSQFATDMLKFINLAVLLSELGRMIEIPNR